MMAQSDRSFEPPKDIEGMWHVRHGPPSFAEARRASEASGGSIRERLAPASGP